MLRVRYGVRAAQRGLHGCGLDQRLQQLVEDNMGLREPMGIQHKAIGRILSKDHPSVVIGDQTGTGKTLAFVLPILQRLIETDQIRQAQLKRTPRAMIISPSKELADQIAGVLRELLHGDILGKCKLSLLIGGEDRQRQLRQLRRGVDIVVGTPGRIENMMRMNHINISALQFMVVDEFDTIFEPPREKRFQRKQKPGFEDKKLKEESPYERSFLFQMDKILESVKKYRLNTTSEVPLLPGLTRIEMAKKEDVKPLQVVLVSATPNSISDINEKYFESKLNFDTIVGQHTRKARSNVSIEWVDCNKTDRQLTLLDVFSLNKKNRKYRSQTLVFCNSIQSARALSHFLDEKRIRNINLHGSIKSAVRLQNFHEFENTREDTVLVATDIGCRGLDFPDVQHVVLFDFPRTETEFLHRIGRTGRGVEQLGKSPVQGKVSVLVSSNDKVKASKLKKLLSDSNPLKSIKSTKTKRARKTRPLNFKVKSDTKKTNKDNPKKNVTSKKSRHGRKSARPKISNS